MNLVHTLQTADHAPLSHAGRYLYEYHGQLEAFLRRQYGARYEDLLARPDLVGQRAVQWFSKVTPPLVRLAELPEDERAAVKRQYWEVRADIDRDIAELEQSRDKDRREWGALMRAVFDDDNNIILTNGTHWCLLWGWAFRNDRENYLAPEFMPAPPRRQAATSPDRSAAADAPSAGGAFVDPDANHEPQGQEQASGQEQEPGPASMTEDLAADDGTVDGGPPEEPPASAMGAFMTKAWRWMLLVLVLLYLACMLKCCVRGRAEAECARMDRLHQRVDAIERRVQENCDTARP
jgi:hypothetical protein